MSNDPSPQSPVSLASHLEALALKDGSRAELFGSVLPAVIDAVGEIARALQRAHRVSLAGTANTFGDDQLNVDVAAEDILRRTFASRCASSVVTASSEEDPVEKPVDHAGASTGPAVGTTTAERYAVAFDPLDGSSIIAPNWTVGTILGVWDGATAVGRAPDEGQVAAVLGVYGPRTTAVVAVRIPGAGAAAASSSCFEVGIGGGAEPEVLRSEVRLSAPPFKTRYFAPANLRAAAQDERYMGLVNGYIREGYTLRYSGGLVPDVVHALVKGHGVYVSPVTAQSKAKLRRLYELYPVALIIEAAGGKAVDPADGRRILDVVLQGTDERAGLVCGTAEEVDKVREALLA